MSFDIIIAWYKQQSETFHPEGRTDKMHAILKSRSLFQWMRIYSAIFSGQTFTETEQKRMAKWAAFWFHDAALTCIWLQKNNINSINDKTFRLLAFAFLLLLFGCIAALSASWNINVFSVLEVSFDDILNGKFNAHKFYIRLHNLPSSSTYLLGTKATKTTTCLKNKNIKRPNKTRMNGKKTNTRKMCKCFQFLSRVSGRSANNSVGDQISGEYKRHHHFFKSLKTSFI